MRPKSPVLRKCEIAHNHAGKIVINDLTGHVRACSDCEGCCFTATWKSENAQKLKHHAKQ
jgi:hypothetical protein